LLKLIKTQHGHGIWLFYELATRGCKNFEQGPMSFGILLTP